jgi:hypothetical protein
MEKVMPEYEVQGFGRDSGRKRKRTYHGANEEAAIQAASKDGTIVETVTKVADDPPPPAPRVPEFRHWHTKVAGVTHGKRQKVISQCQRLESLMLETEDDNPADRNAIKVIRANGQQLGYINADMAPEIRRDVKAGCLFAVYLTNITGGEPNKPTFGANLMIVRGDPGATQAGLAAYIRSIESEGAFESESPMTHNQAQGKSGCLGVVLIFMVIAVSAFGWAIGRI